MERNWTSRLVVAVVTVLALCGGAQAGLEEGIAAAQRSDRRTALAELLPLAERGDATAQYWVGWLYAVLIRPADFEKAVHWYRKSADQGNSLGQGALGMMYDIGYGVPRDEQQAARWHRKAADQGHDWSQYHLGLTYLGGKVVPYDVLQALQLFRKSADQGNPASQRQLGMMYDIGYGVPRDEQQAYFWLLLSSATGLGKEDRDRVEAKLTANQRATAQAEARSWKPKSP